MPSVLCAYRQASRGNVRDTVCTSLLGAVSEPSSGRYPAALSPGTTKGVVACMVIFVFAIIAFRSFSRYRNASKRSLASNPSNARRQQSDPRGRRLGRSATASTVWSRDRPPRSQDITQNDNESVITLPLYTPRSETYERDSQVNLAEPRAAETAPPWSAPANLAIPPPVYSPSAVPPGATEIATAG